MGNLQFEKVKTFAKQLVDAFDVKDGGTQVAVVSYGAKPVVHTLFNSFSGPALNKRNIKDTIDEIDYQSDSVVSPSSALSEVLDTVYADGNGPRNATNKVISPFRSSSHEFSSPYVKFGLILLSLSGSHMKSIRLRPFFALNTKYQVVRAT